ncbi:signal peptidase I [Shewanella sp. NFH-SH190041]|uniref:signal peptidase I n=1 Tax=Shewanella sp. NFH-SH190041 TaxID=2950245 RepID=UPI0021C26113|nr:signal peptidase I [Shewanella sp. NFH-SH190041]BDM63627.1 signal peptidase I [Shewanella sp. NFH-SH190041]
MAAYFSLILVLATLATGLIWLYDIIFLAPKRREKLALAQASGDLTQDAKESIMRESVVVETAHSVFPVIAFVLVLRSFIYEPFQIPSGSMMPTLLVGDFILVEKFSYGLRDPVWRHKLVETGEPARGDVVVFKYPEDPRVDYIKRVVGLPGDKIIYRNKQLWIQPKCTADEKTCPGPQLVPRTEVNSGEFFQDGVPLLRYQEQLGKVTHDILINPARPEMSRYYYHEGTLPIGEWIVPQGEYFVMGDNRDNSRDSRFWGFVPEANLVGKAVAIWISFEFDRSPSDWLPTWIPTGVRFNRIGAIQ